MSEPLTTVIRADDVTCGPRHVAQSVSGARSKGADALLDEPPGRLDRIQVVRVRWQKSDTRPAADNDASDARIFVGAQIVEHDDIPGLQARGQTPSDPRDERLRRGGRPLGAQRHPAALPNGADQRQVLAPVHRARLDVFGPPSDPYVRSPHRKMR